MRPLSLSTIWPFVPLNLLFVMFIFLHLQFGPSFILFRLLLLLSFFLSLFLPYFLFLSFLPEAECFCLLKMIGSPFSFLAHGLVIGPLVSVLLLDKLSNIKWREWPPMRSFIMQELVKRLVKYQHKNFPPSCHLHIFSMQSLNWGAKW